MITVYVQVNRPQTLMRTTGSLMEAKTWRPPDMWSEELRNGEMEDIGEVIMQQ